MHFSRGSKALGQFQVIEFTDVDIWATTSVLRNVSTLIYLQRAGSTLVLLYISSILCPGYHSETKCNGRPDDSQND